jgi:uncharacterized membrane protein
MNLKILSEKRYGIIPNILAGAILVVGFAGFIDASYLTAKRMLGSPLTCYFFGGCDAVNASPYSLMFGVPLSLYGSIFYLLVVLSSVAYLQHKKPIFGIALMILTTLGFVFSGYFLFLQAVMIKAYCFYCVISVGTSTTNFILMSVAWRKYFYKPEVSASVSSEIVG